MSARWAWQPTRDVTPNQVRGDIMPSLDEAYDLAEQWYADGERVAILLWVGYDADDLTADSCGVADTRDPGQEWIVGRERWRRNAQEVGL
jgi:hypothetical protein